MSRLPRLLAMTSIALLAACERSEDTAEPDGPPTTSIAEVLPAVDPPLDRSALLTAVARAASDFAIGRDATARQRNLDGRLFEVGLRFGCSGEAIPTRSWSFDEANRVLRVRVEHELTIDAPEIQELGLEGFEAIEGFWIQRPWLLEAACPAAEPTPVSTEVASSAEEVDDAAPAEESERAPAPPRVGIAHFYTADDSRTLRRDSRAFQATRKLAAGVEPSREGYNLVLSGRLSRMPDGRVIACSGRDPNQPPTCVVSVTFDRVALRRPDGELVAEWSSG